MPISKRPRLSCSRNAKSCGRIGNPRRRGRLPSRQEHKAGVQFIAGESSTRRYFSLLGGRLMRPCAFFCGRFLRSLRLIPSPFFCGEKAHARTETFVVPRRLARILECRVAAGPVPARTHLARQLGRNDHSAAASSDSRSYVLCFTSHSSSPPVSPGILLVRLGFQPS